MASVRSKDFGIFIAKQVRESVSEPSSSNLYLTFGKVQPWTNESEPPQANTCDSVVYEVWKNMVGGKRITGNDIRHVVPRFNWANNTIYAQYDSLVDSRNLKNANTAFYVLTDDWNVYKCLANNNGLASTSKPTSTLTTTDFQTEDGYVWKYMYTVDPASNDKFTTSSFIPVVPNSNVQSNATPGSIDAIIVTNGGIGYDVYEKLIKHYTTKQWRKEPKFLPKEISITSSILLLNRMWIEALMIQNHS
mgnify:CR=1 FL=1